MKRALLIVGAVVAAFLIVRAIVEVLTLHYSDPTSYQHDWGGPSVIGVVLVHCLPGVIAAVAVILVMRRSRAKGAADASG
jgi:hypothetical protein